MFAFARAVVRSLNIAIHAGHYTVADSFKRILPKARELVSTIAELPDGVRSNHRIGHPTLSYPDLPYDALGAYIADHPSMEVNCYTTGIINVGHFDKHITFRYKYMGFQPSRHDATNDYAVVFNVKDLVLEDDMGQVADVLLFIASMDTVIGGEKTIDNFDTWFGNWWNDPIVMKNKSFKEPMVAVNKVKWYLTEAEELLLISKAITDATDKDMFSQAQALYDTILKDYPLMPDKMETVVNIPTIEVLRTILREKMYDLVDAIGFMLPDLKTSPAYSVYKQLYDASDLTLAADLFMVKMFTPKLITLTQENGECPNLTHMGRLVDKAVDALAESLRVR